MNDPEMTMNAPHLCNLAAADQYAQIAYRARQIAYDPVLSRGTIAHFAALARSADTLGRLHYAHALGECPPGIDADTVGNYAAVVYGPAADERTDPHFWVRTPPSSAPPTDPNPPPTPVSVTIEPVAEQAS